MKQQPLREWLTPRFEELGIDGSSIGGGVGEEEEEDLLLPLPSSLLCLHIYHMGNVKRLSSTLPASLMSLHLYNCPELRELAQDGLPRSLRCLEIHNCPKLRKLPQDSLPPCLETLRIKGSGILKERCTEGTGSYWPLIREIPCVDLTGFIIKAEAFIVSFPLGLSASPLHSVVLMSIAVSFSSRALRPLCLPPLVPICSALEMRPSVCTTRASTLVDMDRVRRSYLIALADPADMACDFGCLRYFSTWKYNLVGVSMLNSVDPLVSRLQIRASPLSNSREKADFFFLFVIIQLLR